jgi:hypothetical protein
MTISNDHHFVPAWYQRAFLPDGKGEFFALDKEPVTRVRCPDGAVRKVTNVRDVFKCGSDRLFQVPGLYSVQMAGVRVDAMERAAANLIFTGPKTGIDWLAISAVPMSR